MMRLTEEPFVRCIPESDWEFWCDCLGLDYAVPYERFAGRITQCLAALSVAEEHLGVSFFER